MIHDGIVARIVISLFKAVGIISLVISSVLGIGNPGRIIMRSVGLIVHDYLMGVGWNVIPVPRAVKICLIIAVDES